MLAAAAAAAEAAISVAVEKLGGALSQKKSFLEGVEGNVQWLKDELLYMQALLKDADKKQAEDERIRTWISDIREVAYDAKDVIDTFILKVDGPKRSKGLLNNYFSLPTHSCNLDAVGKEIESIRERLKDSVQRRERYQINENKDLISDDVAESSTRRNVERIRRFAPLEKNKHLVGLNAQVNLLLAKSIFLENSHGLSLAAIFGMGGSGKSTLARAIYDHPEVVARFDCRAWVVASNKFTPQETIKQLLLELKEDKLKEAETLKKMEDFTKDKLRFEQMLHERLRQFLEGKRYFIVVDDLWEEVHWASMRNAFPDEKAHISTRRRHMKVSATLSSPPRGDKAVADSWVNDTATFFELDSRPIMLFDGVCNLCNGGVKFVRDNDRRRNAAFASMPTMMELNCVSSPVTTILTLRV